jgi:uncharacterized repeat protein (TIGR02059 family)
MKKLLLAILATGLILSGCNKSETGTGGPGRLSIKITDDPLDISTVESATVTITKIELRKVGVNDENPFLDLQMTPKQINIFELRNGLTEELVNLVVPNGDYDLVRVYVDEATLKLKNNDETFNLKVPSGEQTGIKIFISPVIHVEGGLSAELILDFDLANSFVMRGKDARNGFIFKPVIRATNNSTAGRVEGVVTDNSTEKVGIEGVTVTLQKEGEAPVTGLTDATGHYLFIGVPAGTYSMSATKDNFESASVDAVVVIAGNKTTQDFILKGIPVYVSSVIENATPAEIDMTYSLALANIVPDVTAFEVTVAGTARSVSSVAISDKVVKLTLASAVLKGEEVKVAYTKPETNPLQTADGIQAASLTAQTVTNNVN